MPVSERRVFQQLYPMPAEVILQLSHRDVNLGFFKGRKREIIMLRSGAELLYENNFLYDSERRLPLAQLSYKMQNELQQWSAKGYRVVSASVRFIVAWRPADAQPGEPEYAVLLADLLLRK